MDWNIPTRVDPYVLLADGNYEIVRSSRSEGDYMEEKL